MTVPYLLAHINILLLATKKEATNTVKTMFVASFVSGPGGS